MKLIWQTYRHPENQFAQDAVEELCDRFRALTGAPVKLVVIQPVRLGRMDVVTVCKSRVALTWIWLAYDCLTDRCRQSVRLKVYTMAEAKRDCVVSDLLRAHLGWRSRRG